MRLLRILCAIPLFFIAGFCVFGDLASFVPSPHNLNFRIGYAILCLGSLGAGAWLMLQKPSPSSGSANESD